VLVNRAAEEGEVIENANEEITRKSLRFVQARQINDIKVKQGVINFFRRRSVMLKTKRTNNNALLAAKVFATSIFDSSFEIAMIT
jgi:hypothetical protein